VFFLDLDEKKKIAKLTPARSRSSSPARADRETQRSRRRLRFSTDIAASVAGSGEVQIIAVGLRRHPRTARPTGST
jgi:hypothetical protein